METTDKSVNYTNIEYPHNIALIVGNEISGVDTRILELSDKIVEIPMYGVKNSLNVSSAFPIVLFEILRQWNIKS
jgi:tRNA G18 (ribose-2'-O)-methylase SpoU